MVQQLHDFTSRQSMSRRLVLSKFVERLMPFAPWLFVSKSNLEQLLFPVVGCFFLEEDDLGFQDGSRVVVVCGCVPVFSNLQFAARLV